MNSLFALALMTTSLLAAGCAEQSYTPIGEDREDKGGGLFHLTSANPSGTIYFDCDDASACDLKLTIALAGSIPEFETATGEEVLLATFTSPDGSMDQSESIVIGSGDEVREDNSLEWSFDYQDIPPGDYSVTLDLGVLDEASVIASSKLAAAE